MSAGWPISRVFLVLPSAGAGSGRPEPTAAALALSLAAELSRRGVHVHRHVAGTPPASVGPFDAALWLADGAGQLPAGNDLDAPARLQIALMPWREGLGDALGARFDGLLVPRLGQVPMLKDHAALPVEQIRLPLTSAGPRETAKLSRRLGSSRVVLLDVRRGLFEELERSIMQLALCSTQATYLLLCPHDEASRARVRSCCVRHGVSAWLLSGAEAFASAVPTAELFIGEPSWQELMWLAAHGVAVCWAGDRADPEVTAGLGVPLGGPIKVLTGVLHLAARIDGMLGDPVGFRTAGRGLKDALIGDPRELLAAVTAMVPRRHADVPTATWEPVGPGHATGVAGLEQAVDAQPTRATPTLDVARVDAQLAALRAQLLRNQGEGHA
ncbi:MAG: hypothetical protein ACO3JL_04945 [Myxococcota bacterium]